MWDKMSDKALYDAVSMPDFLRKHGSKASGPDDFLSTNPNHRKELWEQFQDMKSKQMAKAYKDSDEAAQELISRGYEKYRVKGRGLDTGKSIYGFKNAVTGKTLRQILGPLGLGLGVYAALDSEDAMAAVPGLDSAESIGQSPLEERMMLSEIQAMKNYGNSPAKQDKTLKDILMDVYRKGY